MLPLIERCVVYFITVINAKKVGAFPKKRVIINLNLEYYSLSSTTDTRNKRIIGFTH